MEIEEKGSKKGKKGYVVKSKKWVYPRFPHEKSFHSYILDFHLTISRIYAKSKGSVTFMCPFSNLAFAIERIEP